MESRMVLIKGTKLNERLNKYLQESCVIILASKKDNNEQENIISIKRLLDDIHGVYKSFLPLGIGYHYEMKDEVQRGFLVLPYKLLLRGSGEKSHEVDDEILFNFGKNMTNKYKQKGFLFVKKSQDGDGTIGQLYDANGIVCGESLKNMTVDDLSRVYFASFRNNGESNKNQDKNNISLRTEEIYVNEPSNIMGSHSRASSGEIVIPGCCFRDE
jgi:hypothetical protein